MAEQSEITIGETYLLGEQRLPRILFDTSESGLRKDGLTPVRYKFALVEDDAISINHIDGAELVLSHPNIITTQIQSTTFYHRIQSSFKELSDKIKEAQAHPQKVQIQRRSVTEVKNISELDLLVPDMGVLAIFRLGITANALFRAKEGPEVTLTYRTKTGITQEIFTGVFNAQNMSQAYLGSFARYHKFALNLNDAEIVEKRKLFTWEDCRRTKAPKDYEERDVLLKSRGIYD